MLSSDGLVEAHNPDREMYGFERMENVIASQTDANEIAPSLMLSLAEFTGQDHEQEDDITLVTLQHTLAENTAADDRHWSLVTEFEIPSQPGNERPASQQVMEALGDFDLQTAVAKRLETAVAEATMNAMEHGNQYRDDLPVHIQVLSNETAIAVRVHDFGQGASAVQVPQPDLDAKLSGEQSPRGWGLFLIENMVDEVNVLSTERGQTLELIINRTNV